MTIIVLPTLGYYPDPTQGLPIGLGTVFIGEIDLDPEVLGNRKAVTIVQENGTQVPIAPAAQPLNLGAGGMIMYQGSPVQVITQGSYAMKVLDSLGSQKLYVPNSNSSLGTTAFSRLKYTDGVVNDGLSGTSTGATSGDKIETTHFNSSLIARSGGIFQFTGTTIGGKAGNVPDADGFFYDADGKQFIRVPNTRKYTLKYTNGVIGDGLSGTSIADNFGSILFTGDQVETNHYDSSLTSGSGTLLQYTGTTTIGKAGNSPDIDGYFYDADGKQFKNISDMFFISHWGAAPSVADNQPMCQSAQLYVQTIGGGHLHSHEGVYACSNPITLLSKVIWRGAGMEATEFDFTNSPNYGFFITGGASNFMHGAGMFELRTKNAPSHGFYVNTTTGGGIGEGFFMDRVSANNNGGDGFHFGGDSTPLHIGRLSVHGNDGFGVNFVAETSTHVQVQYIGGDENQLGLVGIDVLNNNGSYYIQGWKAERRSAGRQEDIFVISNASGGFLHIGSGQSLNNTAAAGANAYVKVLSGSNLNLVIDPISEITNAFPSFVYVLENLITSETFTLAQLQKKQFSNVEQVGGQRFAGAPYAGWDNKRNSRSTQLSGNTLRYNHASDGAATTTNVEWYNNTTLIGKLSNSGTWSINGNFRLGGVTTGLVIVKGSGSPEGAVSGSPGWLFMRDDGGAGTSLYVKETGTGNTGWVGK